MKKEVILPTWAPRLKPYLLQRLYAGDAQGLRDDELLDQVGWALYARCSSFIQADEACKGLVRCPVCGNPIKHSFSSREVLHCQVCGWECPWRQYHLTIKDQQLHGGPEVVALFQAYVVDFPKAPTANEKMLLVDALIHGFHHYLTSGRTRRPVAVNLLDGDLGFVIEFLDHLTYGEDSAAEMLKTRDNWQQNIRGKKKTSDI